MRFIPGTVTLNSIQGGTLGSGVVPFPRLTRIIVRGTQGGVVATAVATQIVTADLGNVQLNDYIDVCAIVQTSKGATAGKTTVTIDKSSGSGFFDVGGTRQDLTTTIDQQPLSTIDQVTVSGRFKVITAGSLIIEVTVASAGSNATCQADIQASVLAGQ